MNSKLAFPREKKNPREQWEGLHHRQGSECHASPFLPLSVHQLLLSLNRHHGWACRTGSTFRHQSLPYKWNAFSFGPRLNRRSRISIRPQKDMSFALRGHVRSPCRGAGWLIRANRKCRWQVEATVESDRSPHLPRLVQTARPRMRTGTAPQNTGSKGNKAGPHLKKTAGDRHQRIEMTMVYPTGPW